MKGWMDHLINSYNREFTERFQQVKVLYNFVVFCLDIYHFKKQNKQKLNVFEYGTDKCLQKEKKKEKIR